MNESKMKEKNYKKEWEEIWRCDKVLIYTVIDITMIDAAGVMCYFWLKCMFSKFKWQYFTVYCGNDINSKDG